MTHRILTSLATLILMGCVAAPLSAAADPADVDKAVEILGESVAFDTVAGRGQVPAYAEYLASVLKTAGFAEADIEIIPSGETASLVATYHGKSAETPIVLNAHMDVVEADPADWVRDPFRMESDGTYFYGRGVLDNKYGLTMLVTTLMRLKREGFVPAHDIILVLTGDEETAQVTAADLAPRFRGARMVLNADAGGGTLGEDGKPRYYSLQAGEKTYADFEIVMTDAGGHSSRPTGSNAIVDMSGALTRVGAYAFPPQTSELTQAYFRETAKQVPGPLGAAMARFADNPEDAEAVALHDLRRHTDSWRPCPERPAPARDGEHQLPDIPRRGAAHGAGETPGTGGRGRHGELPRGVSAERDLAAGRCADGGLAQGG